MIDMQKLLPSRIRFQNTLDKLRVNLSHPNALFQITVLGVVTGVIVGVVMIAFQLTIEWSQSITLGGSITDNFEALPIWLRILFPIGGSLLIVLCFRLFARGQFIVGVVHVMEQMAYHQGRLHLRGMIMQFVGATLAIATGHSVGREGPGIHLGAASSSLLGQFFGLPNNTIRTLVACGTAAAIAASFNTPLAGVIFALEVVMMEYTLASFTPVIAAAVSATTTTRILYESDPATSFPMLEMMTLFELPIAMALGICVGITSAIFVWLIKRSAMHTQQYSFGLRILIAGLITGLCAAMVPQVMGIGYDTIAATLMGNLGLAVLLSILILKIVATATAIGLAVPAGVIGPTLVIGTTLGAIFGILANTVFPEFTTSSGTYALLGMGAMMGATLQAPLAALMAIFELTDNPDVILPGMLVILTASLCASQLFGQQSVFHTLMQSRGLDYRHDPVTQAMRRMGVASIMDRRFLTIQHLSSRKSVDNLLTEHPQWILINKEENAIALMPALDLARYLAASDEEHLDLLQIPAHRFDISPIDIQASVDEALEQLSNSQVETLYVRRLTSTGSQRVYGILTKEALENSYRI